MHVQGFLHKILELAIPQKRLLTLSLLIDGLLHSKKLSVTELGRGMKTPCVIQERSAIKRADRFVGNSKLHEELHAVYFQQSKILIGNKKRPKIIVDWSHVPNTDFFVLRASLATKGRALTLYEEIHPEKKLGNGKKESAFLNSLKMILPLDCKPIIISDAGFRNPWFIKIIQLGWDYVGRVRGTHTFFNGTRWIKCTDLFSKANKNAKFLGKVKLCKKLTINSGLFLLKEKGKNERWRKKYKKKNGKKDEINYRKGATDPWVLASSLQGNSPLKIQRVIKIYKSRMQIEEGFRDLKNPKYGFGLRNAHSRDSKRIRILLLIAMLASLIAWLCGYVAEKNNWQRFFQINTIMARRVLSLFFLGCRVINRNYNITEAMLDSALVEIRGFSR